MTHLLLPAVVGFLIGAVIVTVVRTVGHQPYAAPVPVPAAMHPQPHARHSAASAPAAPAPAPAPSASAPAAPRVINTICPICGMDVDPSIPPAAWDGVLVGFGCRACPPEFANDPARYGAAARTNTVVEP
jgi:hypothetical protein